jgi:hypothetical protein
MVEREQLRDETADAHPGHVRTSQIQRHQQLGRVGDEVAEVIGGRVRVDERRLAGVAKVIAHHAPPGQRRAQLVRPAQHGDADQQHRWVRRVPEGLRAQLDAVDLDPLHEGPSGWRWLFLRDGPSGGAKLIGLGPQPNVSGRAARLCAAGRVTAG